MVVSIIAIIISFVSFIFSAVTYFKQYKKTLYIQIDYRTTLIKNNIKYSAISVSVTNTSQFPIYIKEIGLKAFNNEINKFEYVWLGCIEPDYDENTIKILPQEGKEFYFEISTIAPFIDENIANGIGEKKVKIAVKDSTNKKYTKKCVTNEIMKKLLKRV